MVTKKSFLKDVESHRLTILHEYDYYRHLRFKAPGTGVLLFDLITYPGGLVFRGDMGSFTFERVKDMFNFFRGDEISPGYWAEKCIAQDRTDGISKFSLRELEKSIREYHEEHFSDSDGVMKKLILQDLEEQVFKPSGEEEWRWWANIDSFRSGQSEGFDLMEGFIDGCIRYKEPSYRYMWACYAIQWGISIYDKEKGNDAD